MEKGGPLPFTMSTRTVGPLTMTLGQVPYLTEYRHAYSIHYTLQNTASEAIACSLVFTSSDAVSPLDDKDVPTPSVKRSVTVPAQGKIEGTFRYWGDHGTWRSVHYPLAVATEFAFKGKSQVFDTIRVVETDLPAEPKSFETTKIKLGGVSLIGKSYEVSYAIAGGPVVELGRNWFGRDKASSLTLSIRAERIGNETRQVLSMHPPYVPKGGSLYLRFPVELPKLNGLSLSYGCCVPYSPSQAKRSDGVTYRIWAKLPESEKILLDECNTAQDQWQDRKVDLSRVAGMKCDLVLEVNPGPKNNTAFDSSAVSGLIINSVNGVSLTADRSDVKRYRFELTQERTAIVESGPNGLIDANITLQSQGSSVTYRGIRLAVGKCELNNSMTRFAQAPDIQWDAAKQILTCRYRLLNEDQINDVTIRALAMGGMFVLDVPKEGNPVNIANLEIGPSDQKIKRVYFGHGYAVEGTKRVVRIHGGGHGLSTSHIGVEYENGLAVLSGTSFPPEALNIDPKANIGSMEVTGPTKLAFLPSAGNMFDAAVEYRNTSPWIGKPGPGVARKAGRLVFDTWGLTTKDLTRIMKRVFDYGVTDSLFLAHNWQRWGYDIRLPNIWEDGGEDVIRPRFGKVEELRAFNQLCAKYGVPFGLHDNYTDFYPDAEKFSYKYVNFMPNGQPQQAWLNPGRARSYKWRCDLVKPFLEHNLKLANKYLPEMDAYFIDVLTSSNVNSFYTIEGEYRPRSVTQDSWKDLFLTVSRYLTQTDASGKKLPGITTSEAGDDFLIGALDGADAQWLELSDKQIISTIFLPCENWERVPWFAAVNHTNFSRHGAGYNSRYQNVRSVSSHGICSDDYITSEVLGALDPMVDLRSLYPQSIRKYYLTQHIAKRFATCNITKVQFDKTNGNENIHRQKISWTDGSVVIANRGATDFATNGYQLPRYSYVVLDKNGKLLSGIFRNPQFPQAVVEASDRGNSFYMNARCYSLSDGYRIEPKMAAFEQVSNNVYKIKIDWYAKDSLPNDAHVFVHL
ncbi:MAG: endo-alpha-N-acetylgalactosaminidase family protein, partial [Planctomycetia bacterium]|nr:endo-alpha-N-acetylgalactosaminidase family protein [Planctomycetia bacterium]